MSGLGAILWNILGVATALLAVVYAYFKWSYQYWKRKNVPYFEGKIPFGSLGNPFTTHMDESISQLYYKAKAKGWKFCGLYILSAPSLLILDLELLKNILMKDFQHFPDRGLYTNERDDPIGAHLAALSGSRWKSMRSKLTPTFTSGKLKAMFQTLVDCGLVFEQYVAENIKPEEPIDIKNVLSCFSTDIIGSCAFGLECNSFKEPDSAFRRFGINALATSKLGALKSLFCQSFPDLARSLRIRQTSPPLEEFFTKIVEDTISYREKNNVVRKDFLQLLMEMRAKDDSVAGDSNTLTMNEIVAQSFVFFLAGFETSASTMTFALFELATHPEIQERLRKEIIEVLAKHDGKMTYDTLSEMKYLSQVIDESPLKMPTVKSGETFGSMGCDQLQRRLRNAPEDHHYPRNGSDRIGRNTNNRNQNQYMDRPRDTDSGSVPTEPSPRTTTAETLRMHAPAQALQRVCVSDYKIPGSDVVIEKGCRVAISVNALHYDEDYWTNPNEFNPDRFNEENKKNRNQFTFIPFGQGPRICIGERFALMQVRVGLTCLLRKFRVKLDKKTQLPLKKAAGANSLLSTEGGIWVNLEKI